MDLLVVSGGDHPYDESTPILEEFLIEAGHAVRVTEDADVLASDGIRDYDVLVFNTLRAQELTLEADERAGLTRFIEGGKGFVCIHISGCRPDAWHDYHDVTGGGWVMDESTHPPYGQFSVRVKNADHPCADDIKDFVTNDELYIKLDWRPGNDVFLTADLDGEPQSIAWTRSFGDGRVFSTTLGHDGLSFRTPAFQRLILNGVKWSAGAS